MRRKPRIAIPFTLAFVLALLSLQFAGGTLAFGSEEGALTLAAGQIQDDGTLSVSFVERSWDGTKVTSETKTHDAVAVPADGGMTSGWYYLNSNVTKNGRIESISGDVNLILGDGCTLDVKGLYVPAGSTLTIYGQSADTGKIYSHPDGGGAAIGGYSQHDNGNIVIHGGTIEANGDGHCAGIGSNDGCAGGSITIYGGTVTAKGGSDGAAIGGGRNCSGGTITIYGGDITANGPTDKDTCENGAGIGGGDCGAGGTIEINGGTITTYSRDGAGIGGGDDGDGGSITINGGTITSTKVNQGQGARIGGGCDAAPGTVLVNGGTITTIGGSGAGLGGGKGNKEGGSVGIIGGVIKSSGNYGIGSGEGGKDVSIILAYDDATRNSISITASTFHGTVFLGNRFRNDSGNYEMGSIDNLTTLAGSALVAWDGTTGGIDYVDPSKGPQTHTGAYSTIGSSVSMLSEGWYAVGGNTTVKNEIAVSGNVNLILKDGCKLNVPNIKVPAGSKLTIWGQSGGSGTIIAKSDDETKAGIGGADCDCGTITINGGVIEATGGNSKDGCYGSAGIGGSYDCKPGTVVINDGTVSATGGKSAAGIGSGAWVNNQGISAGKVEIHGGTVTARGKNGGAGIGSGLVYEWLEIKVNFGSGRNGVNATGTITITGGTVNAYGSEHPKSETGNLATEMRRGTAAAIGGGVLSTAGTITISGGEVNANAVKDGAAIGTGGFDGASYWTRSGGTIKISGGTVNAVGYKGGDGAAIGGGFACGAEKIEISGGTVTATGGCYAIGRGKDCNPACVTYLSWKDSTKDSMSVTADSYDTKLAMMNDFKDRADGTVFPAANPVNDLARLAGRTLVPADNQTEFTITLGPSVPEGVLTTDYQSAAPDTKVTITVHDKDGFNWNEILVLDKDLNLVKKLEARYVKDSDNTGFFFMPYSDVTIEMDIYGNECLVTFDSDGGSAVDSVSVASGGTVPKPEDPVKEGYAFAGWYLMEGGTMAAEPFDFSTSINENITLKARWTKAKTTGSSSSTKASPKTGDGVPVALFAALALASGALLVLAAKRRRER